MGVTIIDARLDNVGESAEGGVGGKSRLTTLALRSLSLSFLAATMS